MSDIKEGIEEADKSSKMTVLNAYMEIIWTRKEHNFEKTMIKEAKTFLYRKIKPWMIQLWENNWELPSNSSHIYIKFKKKSHDMPSWISNKVQTDIVFLGKKFSNICKYL